MCQVVEGEEAVYSFAWEWGETGLCGHTGRTLLQQASGNLGRRVDFHPLDTGPRPMELEERAQFAGRVFALEHELAAVRDRGQALYLETERLRADNRLLVVQKGQLEARLANELEPLRRRVQELTEELASERRDLAAVVEERDILRDMIGDAGRPTSAPEVSEPVVVE
jgi:hypothetical protein